MTVEEAKKILEKEGFKLEGPGKSRVVSKYFTEYESHEICEAMQTVCSVGYEIKMPFGVIEARKARMSLELAENIKTPGPGEEQPKEGNPALKESASQFSNALLDEQAKKIEELTKDKELMKKATLSQLDDFIEIYNLLTKESQKTKRLGKEIARLNGIIHDKNEEIKRKTKGCCELVAENVDLKEGLRKTESLLHDTREANSRNLDTCFKNEDLINELKEKLAEKTKLAKKYAKELSDSSLDLCKLERKLKKQLKDKNAVLSDVAEELRLSKIREKNLVEVSQKYIKEKEKLKKEIADLGKELKAKKALVDHISKIRDSAKINLKLRMDECEKLKLALDEAKKQNTAAMVDMTAKCLRAARESINDVFESYAAKYAKSSLDDLKEKAYELFNAKAHSLGLVGNKDGNGIIEQMVGADIAEEGGDQSAIIMQCDNGIILSKEEVEIIERCTKNGTELHYSEKDGLTYTNMYGEEIPIICLRGMFHISTDEEIKNMKK